MINIGLKKDNVDFIATIVGDPLPKDESFYNRLKFRVSELELAGQVKFLSGVRHDRTLELYCGHEIFINLTPSGSFDKTILEAMACESVVIVANLSLLDFLPSEFICQEDQIEDLAERVKKVLMLKEEERENLGYNFRQTVIDNHSLSSLVKKVMLVENNHKQNNFSEK